MNQPVRLEKQEEFSLKDYLNQELTFKVKYYFLIFIFAVMFFVVAFMVKGPTYGYF